MSDGMKIGLDIPSCKGIPDVTPLEKKTEDVTGTRFVLGVAGRGMCRFEKKRNGIMYGSFEKVRVPESPPQPPVPSAVAAPPVYTGPYASPVGITPTETPDEDDFVTKLLMYSAVLTLGIAGSAAVLVYNSRPEDAVEDIYSARRKRRRRKLRNPPPADAEKKNRIGTVKGVEYAELSGVHELKNGDILPGSEFVLGDPNTYGRELLTINFTDTSRAHEVLVRAKRIGEESKAEGKTQLEIADSVSEMVNLSFSPYQYGPAEEGQQTVGIFMEEGGCCRHRAALLQMAFQEAGIRSRYVRLQVVGGGSHAVVEADLEGKGSYDYVYDPNMGISGKAVSEPDPLIESKFLLNVTDAVDGKSVLYLKDPVEFNIVWRPASEPSNGATIISRRPLGDIAKASISEVGSITTASESQPPLIRFVNPAVERTVEALRADPKAGVENMFDEELREWAQAINEYLEDIPKARRKYLDKSGLLKPGSPSKLLAHLSKQIKKGRMEMPEGIARAREEEALKRAREADASRRGGFHDRDRPEEKAIE